MGIHSRTVIVSILVLLVCVATPCTAQTTRVSPLRGPDDPLVDGNRQFAFDLYGKLCKNGENVFFSPLSLSNALALSYSGARENTAKEIKDVLHFELEPARLPQAMAALVDGLREKHEPRESCQLSIANGVWVEQTCGLKPEFVSLAENDYHASAKAMDFVHAADAQRKAINSWFEEHTSGKIKDVLSEGSLTNETRLVLTNAAYFKSHWESEFRPADTKPGKFTMAGGKTVSVPMMHQKWEFFYLEDEHVQILAMPYDGYSLVMIVLLPRKVDGLPDLEKALNAKAWADWMEKMREVEVEVEFPRFEVNCSFDLDGVLRELGMRDAFSRIAADFSGMSERPVFIDAVMHQASVVVNEEGTEAAAATIVKTFAGKGPKPPPREFRADHPFIFAIRDFQPGSILFLGRVMNPKAGGE